MKSFPKTPPGGWKVVLADPPWDYENRRTRSAASKNYPTLDLESLKMIWPYGTAAEDSALFMWATCPFLPEALELGAAWGFTFKTVAFWWGKRNLVSNTPFFGMGNWTRANGEPCLLFTRGKVKRADAGVPQFYWGRRLRHSEKPDEIRKRIVRLIGDVPRLELFSRHNVPGWSRWGNELLP